MIDSASVVATAEEPVVRRKKTRRKLTFDRVSFFVVFLGLPLSIFLLFVVWPFVQAFYYSLTDWSGFTPDMNFVGLRNYRTLLHDDIFMTAFWNNVLLAVVVPLVTVVLSFVLATMVTVGGTTHGAARGIRALELLPGDLVLPLHDPGDHHRNPVESDVRPVRRPGERHPHQARVRPVRQLPLARGHPHRHAGLDVRDHLGLRRLLHGAVRRSDQGDPVGLLRRDPAGRRRPDPDGVVDHDPVDPRQHPDRLHLPGHRGPRRVRLHGCAQPRRRAGQLDPCDATATAHHRIHEGSVRPRQRDGRGAGPRDPRASRRSSSP